MKLLFFDGPVLSDRNAYLPIKPAKHFLVRYDLTKAPENWLARAKVQEIFGKKMFAGDAFLTPDAKHNEAARKLWMTPPKQIARNAALRKQAEE